MQRQVIQQRPVADHQPGCMRARRAKGAFQLARRVHHRHQLRLRRRLAEVRDLRQRALNGVRVGGNLRHKLGHAAHISQRNAHHPPHVAQRVAGFECVKGNDVRDALLAIALRAILKHLGAPVVLKVKIDIGHVAAVDVEKALEDQCVAQRLHQRNVAQVRHQRAGCRPARVKPNPVARSVGAQVVHQQEVAGKAHALDGVQLHVQPRLQRCAIRRLRIFARQCLQAQLAQVAIHSLAGRHGKVRQVIAAGVQVYIAALRNFNRIGKRTGHMPKQQLHFLRRAQVVAVAGHAHAARVR